MKYLLESMFDHDNVSELKMKLSVAISLKRIADALESKNRFSYALYSINNTFLGAYPTLEQAYKVGEDLKYHIGNCTVREVI